MADFVTSDGLRLHFEDEGRGRVLLCLPGLTRNCRDFDFYAPHAAGMRLVRMDYRGRGDSDRDDDYMNYNVLREAHDVVELLDHLQVGRVTVLGTSRGGLIAMALAASNPDRLQGVILNDIGPVVGAAGLARITSYVGRKPRAKTLDQAAADLKSAMQAEFPGVPLETWRRQAEHQYRQTPEGLDLRYDARLHKALLEQAATGAMPDLWLFFQALAKLPAAALRGENSVVLEHDTLEEMRRRHPGMMTAEVPDRGHAPFLDEPESLALIDRFLETTQ